MAREKIQKDKNKNVKNENNLSEKEIFLIKKLKKLERSVR